MTITLVKGLGYFRYCQNSCSSFCVMFQSNRRKLKHSTRNSRQGSKGHKIDKTQELKTPETDWFVKCWLQVKAQCTLHILCYDVACCTSQSGGRTVPVETSLGTFSLKWKDKCHSDLEYVVLSQIIFSHLMKKFWVKNACNCITVKTKPNISNIRNLWSSLQ